MIKHHLKKQKHVEAILPTSEVYLKVKLRINNSLGIGKRKITGVFTTFPNVLSIIAPVPKHVSPLAQVLKSRDLLHRVSFGEGGSWVHREMMGDPFKGSTID